MMADGHDLNLQALFAETGPELDGDAFTENVLAGTRRLVYRVAAVAAGLVLVFLACAWLFAIPVQHFAFLLTDILARTLVDLGDGWLAWIFTPVNNVAGLLVLCAKMARMAWKRLIRRSG